MREILNSSVFGNIEIEAQKKIRKDINERWDRLGLCEGLDGHLKETVATLYENQAKHLIYEATASDNSGSFETVVFPLIRRVFSKLLANDIVSVQAMNLPIGKLFFIKPVTSERDWNFQAEDKLSDGDTGRHYGLMGYERQNRHYNGEDFDENDERTWKTKNRFYLPDEVVGDMAFVEAVDDAAAYLLDASLLERFNLREQGLDIVYFLGELTLEGGSLLTTEVHERTDGLLGYGARYGPFVVTQLNDFGAGEDVGQAQERRQPMLLGVFEVEVVDNRADLLDIGTEDGTIDGHCGTGVVALDVEAEVYFSALQRLSNHTAQLHLLLAVDGCYTCLQVKCFAIDRFDFCRYFLATEVGRCLAVARHGEDHGKWRG